MNIKKYVLICSAVLLAWPARAEINYTSINAVLVDRVIVPAYETLKETTSQQRDQWHAACQHPMDLNLFELQTRFHDVSDAWARVFHWNLGPISLYLRRDRFYHWPERRNSVNKGLTKLLAAEDTSALEAERFKKVSVAAQGLPALERLLFEDIDLVTHARACKVGVTIATNLADIAHAVLNEWKSDVQIKLSQGASHPDYFEEPSDFLNRVFNELTTGYAIIKDQKILAVMGSSAKKAKPRLLEYQRSHRFSRNLVINLQALYETQQIISQFLPVAERKKMGESYKKSQMLLEDIHDFETAISNNSDRQKLQKFITALVEMRDQMVAAYVTHLKLVVGFNSLDGD